MHLGLTCPESKVCVAENSPKARRFVMLRACDLRGHDWWECRCGMYGQHGMGTLRRGVGEREVDGIRELRRAKADGTRALVRGDGGGEGGKGEGRGNGMGGGGSG
jgi:hypothetical protein